MHGPASAIWRPTGDAFSATPNSQPKPVSTPMRWSSSAVESQLPATAVPHRVTRRQSRSAVFGREPPRRTGRPERAVGDAEARLDPEIAAAPDRRYGHSNRRADWVDPLAVRARRDEDCPRYRGEMSGHQVGHEVTSRRRRIPRVSDRDSLAALRTASARLRYAAPVATGECVVC